MAPIPSAQADDREVLARLIDPPAFENSGYLYGRRVAAGAKADAILAAGFARRRSAADEGTVYLLCYHGTPSFAFHTYEEAQQALAVACKTSDNYTTTSCAIAPPEASDRCPSIEEIHEHYTKLGAKPVPEAELDAWIDRAGEATAEDYDAIGKRLPAADEIDRQAGM